MIVNRPNVDIFVAPDKCDTSKKFPEFNQTIQKGIVNNKDARFKFTNSRIIKDDGKGR